MLIAFPIALTGSTTMYRSNRRSFLASVLFAAKGLTAPTKKYRVAVIGDTGHGDYGHGIDTVWTAFETDGSGSGR